MRADLDPEISARVIAEAKKDAKLFVDEFSDQIDPGETDWDGTAWEDARLAARVPEDRETDYFPLYSQTLLAETQRLCSEPA